MLLEYDVINNKVVIDNNSWNIDFIIKLCIGLNYNYTIITQNKKRIIVIDTSNIDYNDLVNLAKNDG